MTVGKVQNVDVVTDGGSVAGVVVLKCLSAFFFRFRVVYCCRRGAMLTVAENEQLFTLASSNLSQQRQQVVGHTLRVLTHDTRGVGTSRVEVTQQSTVPLAGLGLVAGLGGIVALSVDQVGDGVLNSELGVSVGVGGAQRADLGDGDHVRETGSITVNGGRAREDDVGNIVADHRAQETDGAVDVDMVVVQGLLARFPDSLFGEY